MNRFAKFAALLWLGIVILAGCYLSARVYDGLTFRTDLMALLPQEQQNPEIKKTNDRVTQALSRRVVFLVGDKDRAAAREAAAELSHQFSASGVFDVSTNDFDKSQLRQLGALYYPYRAGLLSEGDRDRLMSDKAMEAGQGIAARALSQVYGVIGFANASLLHGDPFLLLPSFLTGLPVPLSRVALDEGLLSLQDNGTTWVLIAGRLNGEPYALDAQKKAADLYDSAVQGQRNAHPGLTVLRLGAVFFAKAGAEQAMSETASIGVISTLGTILLIVGMFRAIRPLLLSLLVIGVGVVAALAASLLIFGELHVGALLFGISLIGVSVDYSLQYCSEVFSPKLATPGQRLKRVFVGITIGTATTVIGYLTLCLAPFPGLHQIAAFSAVGLVASWLTVVLWLPRLDRKQDEPCGQGLLVKAGRVMALWEDAKYRHPRVLLLAAFVVAEAVGFARFHTDDNVRHMQSLSSGLVAEQEKIQTLIGTTAGSQFFIVQASSDEEALQREEKLIDKLLPLVASGALAGFQAVAHYVPSSERQKDNRLLQAQVLYGPLLARQTAQLGLTNAPELPKSNAPFLTLAEVVKRDKPPAFLSALVLNGEDGEVMHMVALDAVTEPEIVAQAAEGIAGIRYVDPTSDFSNLLGKYRNRALRLLALSAALMAPLLAWRYGWLKGVRIIVPPLLAVVLAPALCALAGGAFTFFDAMALVLVLSIGVDYAVFFAETTEERKSVTLLAVTMAACTALLSFGLLALSHVAAVHNFGATMSLGVLLSFLFAPMARRSCVKIPRTVLSIALVFILCGCASTPAIKPAPKMDTVQIAPELKITMPHASDLGRSVEVTQLVTAHYGEQVFAFEARISATPQRLLLVGLDLMGRRLFTIDWTDEALVYETAPWVPPQLRPENILADIVMLYWPDGAVRRTLAASAGTLLVSPDRREIVVGDKIIWQAAYAANARVDHWSGNLYYSNVAWGYQFDVQSTEQAP